MKRRVRFGVVVFFGIMVSVCLAQNPGSFADLYQTAQTHQEAGRYVEAQAAYEKALDSNDVITLEQRTQALFNLAEVCTAKGRKMRPGRAALQKICALEGVSNETKIRAGLLLGDASFKYPAVLEQARDAFVEVLNFPEITPEQRIDARKGLIKALMYLRQFGEARSAMVVLSGDANLAPAEKLANQISIGTTFMLEGMYVEATSALKKALLMEGGTDAQKADIQLKLALSYYETGDFERARPELEKVLAIPGVDGQEYRRDELNNLLTPPAREARLRLLKMNPADEKEKTVTALFIGSSMTLRGFMPFLVERLSAAAPAGRPRIVSGMYTRSGTRLNTFWDEGNGGGTARNMIESVPWDFVVVETYRSMKLEDVLKYGRLYTDHARGMEIEPVFYETHTEQSSPFPERALEYHERNIALRGEVKAPVAPVALAEIYYLEAVPTAKREEFHADYIHPSEKGYYLEAYCIYATITGYSPLGLPHPKRMSDEDAKALQEAAWRAVQETNPNLKPWE